MGGYGSGRHSGKPALDDTIKLTVSQLVQGQSIRPGSTIRQVVSWADAVSGEGLASIDVEARFEMRDRGRAWLRYIVVDPSGAEHMIHDAVGLIARSQPFGGHLWFFICPMTGQRVTSLYLPGAARSFASRHAHQLGYRSQRENTADRALRKAFKIRSRIEVSGRIEKPRGMHRATFDRILNSLQHADEVCDLHLIDYTREVGAPNSCIK